MAELKTKPTEINVEDFLNKIENENTKKDCFRLNEIMENITQSKAKIWGEGIIGYGDYHYKYASGREGDWFYTGFVARKQNITIYLMCGVENFNDLMKDLGKFKASNSCLYIKKLSDIDENVLIKLISESINYLKSKYHV